jgi:PAS domain S-box-containing protein
MNKLRSQEIQLDRLVGLRKEIEHLRGVKRKQESAIEALKEKEFLYWELFNRSNDGVAVIQGPIIKEVNPALVKMLRSPKAKLRNRRYTDFLSQETLLGGKDLYERRHRGENVTSVFETAIVDRCGKKIPVEINAGLTIYDSETADLVIIRDLTYLKRAEAEIIRLKEYGETFLDHINIWLEVYDDKKNVVVWNKAAEEISGYSKEEIVRKRKNLELLYPDPKQRRNVQKKLWGDISSRPDVASFETEIVRKDAQKRTLTWYARSITDEDAIVMGQIVLGLDITARIQAEATLERSKKTIYALLNAITESIYLIDRRGLILATNSITARRWKKEGQDLAGRIVYDLLPKGPEEVLRSNVLRVIRIRAPVRYDHSDEGRYFDTTIYPIFGNDDRLEQMAVFTVDVTEKKKAEDAFMRQKTLLEEKNVALREMIRQVGDEKKLIGKQVKANVNRLLLPLVSSLKVKGAGIDATYLDLLENSLKELTSSFGQELDSRDLKLTQRELEISHMIKNGLTSKQIAQLINVSPRTVEIHRGHIRKKLGLRKRRQNLQVFLGKLSSSQSPNT